MHKFKWYAGSDLKEFLKENWQSLLILFELEKDSNLRDHSVVSYIYSSSVWSFSFATMLSPGVQKLWFPRFPRRWKINLKAIRAFDQIDNISPLKGTGKLVREISRKIYININWQIVMWFHTACLLLQKKKRTRDK